MSESPTPATARQVTLRLESIEWLASGPSSGMLRLRGSHENSPGRGSDPPALALRSGDEVQRFASLRDARADGGSWRAAYLLDSEVVRAAQEGWVEWADGARLQLPPIQVAEHDAVTDLAAAQPGEPVEPEGEVIDRAVLAERRAQRAETAQRAQAKAAADALDALGALERRLDDLTRERDELTARSLAAEAAERSALEPVQAAPHESAAPEPAALAELREQLEAARSAQSQAEERHEQQGKALSGALNSLARLRLQASELRWRLRTQTAAGAADAVRVAVLESERRNWHPQMLAARREAAALQQELERAARERDEAAAARSATDARVSELMSERDELRSALNAERTARRDAERDAAAQREHAEQARTALLSARREAEQTREAAGALKTRMQELQAELEQTRTELKEARERLRELSATPAPAPPASAPEAPAPPASAPEAADDREELLRRAREQADAASAVRAPAEQAGRIAAQLDAAAALLRASAPAPVEAPEPDEEAEVPGGQEAPAAAPASSSLAIVRRASSALAVTVPRDADDPALAGHPLLRDALVAFAREDPFHAARLLAGLLPAQGAFLDTEIDYDLTIRELGSFAVTVAGGRAAVRSLRRPRSRRDAELHIAAHALTLAELLAGRPQRVGRFLGPLRVRGSRRRLAALDALADARPTIADVARAGARLDCNLVMRVLPHVIPPAWTQNHSFTILHELSDQPASDWYVTAAGPAGLSVSPMPPAGAVDARVTMTAAAFDRLLRAEAPTRPEKPWIRGDLTAVGALRGWIERATH